MTPRPLLGLSAAIALVLGLAACDTIRTRFARSDASDASASDSGRSSFVDDGAGDTSQDPTTTRGERSIQFPVVAESVSRDLFPEGGAARFAEASVPVLAPAGMSSDQAARFLDSYRTTPDGYFARLNLEDFDVVVNGTRVYRVAPEAAGVEPRDITGLQVAESETGLSVTFNRFGADYSIDFVCRGAGDEAGATCIDEAGATEFAESLIPVGGGG